MITNNRVRPVIIPNCDVMIVGDFPTTDDVIRGAPFTGTTGKILDEFLHNVGIVRHDCSITTLMKSAPLYGKEEHLYADKGKKKPKAECYEAAKVLAEEINKVRPKVVLALGNLSLWALTGQISANKWRGSVIQAKEEFGNVKVVCTLDPRICMRMWEWRPLIQRDIKRARDESLYADMRRPPWSFHIRPSFDTVQLHLNAIAAKLEEGPYKMAADIETRGAMTACIGVAWNKHEALCIPLMAVGAPGSNYWAEHEEVWILDRLRHIMTHPNMRLIGQNWGYDAQYFAVQAGFLPPVYYDTMLMQHTVFAGMKKSLDFMASMYCEFYQYWKDDGKHWDAKIPEEQYWTYNCEDCVRTYECAEVLEDMLERSQLQDQYKFLREMWPHVVRTMLRGVRIDEKARNVVAQDLIQFIEDTKHEIYQILGHEINIGSPAQMMKLFYEDLKLPVVKNKKTKRPTTDDDALNLIKKREPLLTGLVERIAMVRSAGVLLSTFCLMPLDIDKRMRCYYNVAGTETYRLNSGENAFGSGGNLQNIPKGDEDKAAAKKLELINAGRRQLIVPNIRKFFVPDPGKTFFDIDLDRADLMVVIWEADDDDLRAAVREGVDLHTYNASVLFGVSESGVTYALRQAAKQFAHGTNYGGSARTMAITCGLTVHASEVAQRRWFSAHPGIKEWHRRTEASLQATREVRNVFGFRRRYFDRIESILPEALAWQPQSVVAIVINKAWKQLAEQVPECEVLLQVHDSVAGQFPTHIANPVMRKMEQAMKVHVPYDKPLIIGSGIAVSQKSWGDVESIPWPAPLPSLQASGSSGNIVIPA